MACTGIPHPIIRMRLKTSNPDHGRAASGVLHFMNIDATAVLQGPKMQKANGGNNGRTRNAVQSIKQATTWVNCAEGAKPNIWPNLLKGWVGGVGPPPSPPWGAELLKGTLAAGVQSFFSHNAVQCT